MTKYTSQVFQEEKFWHKKCFANNRNDSRINKIRSVGVTNDKEGFRFYIFCCLKP